MPGQRRQPEPSPAAFTAADRLHSAAIRLLRSIRVEDRASGLSGPRLSALSVVVFGGPLPMSALAAAEQVQPPTISRLVAELERDGLVERVRDQEDRRVLQVRATALGRRLMEEGRRRRVVRLAAALEALPAPDRKLLARAAELILRLANPPRTPPSRNTPPVPAD
jgi:DNA-binding MarR family transcriptional regulator